MNRLRKKQLAEAIARMEMLKIKPNIIKEFKSGILNYSEDLFLYWLTDDMKEIVFLFEAEHNAIVYHIIRSFTDYGETLSLLYVSDNIEEWEKDKNDISQNCQYVYVKYCDNDVYSDFCSIIIKPVLSTVFRIS